MVVGDIERRIAEDALPRSLCGKADGGLSVGGTGKPLGLDTLDVVVHGLGFLRLGRRIGLGLLLRQLTRMAHNKAQFLQRDPSLAVLPIHWAEHALPIPTTRPLVTHPPRLLY